MKRISTLVFAAAVMAPVSFAAGEVTSTAVVELYSGKTVNINNEAFTCPGVTGPMTIEDVDYLGTWTSAEGNFRYNPETGHYFINNFLGGGNKMTLEFSVGDVARDFNVYSTNESTEVNTPLINPVRYDFCLYFLTGEGKDTYGLTPAEYTGYSIIPNPSMTNSNWTQFNRFNSTDGQALGAFKADNGDSYTFVSGLRLYATTPQRSATGTITPCNPVPDGTALPDGVGTEAPSMAQFSYVVKDGDNYTVYLSVVKNGYNKLYKNDDTSANLASDGAVLKIKFNKNTLAGVEDIVIDDSDESNVEYYNLQGVRVKNPAAGLYIRRCGDKAEKVVLQ